MAPRFGDFMVSDILKYILGANKRLPNFYFAKCRGSQSCNTVRAVKASGKCWILFNLLSLFNGLWPQAWLPTQRDSMPPKDKHHGPRKEVNECIECGQLPEMLSVNLEMHCSFWWA